MQVTTLKENPQLRPTNFSLSQNYPNPFNPGTTINYQLPASNKVHLIIYNMTGQKVRTLVNRTQMTGQYSVTFNADGLASGVYLFRLSTDNGFVQTKKMILMR